jgi:hypothetical protein
MYNIQIQIEESLSTIHALRTERFMQSCQEACIDFDSNSRTLIRSESKKSILLLSVADSPFSDKNQILVLDPSRADVALNGP